MNPFLSSLAIAAVLAAPSAVAGTLVLTGTTQATLQDGVVDILVFTVDSTDSPTLVQGGYWIPDNVSIYNVPAVTGFNAAEDFIDLRQTTLRHYEPGSIAFSSDVADLGNYPFYGSDTFFTSYGYGSLNGKQYSISGNTLGAGGTDKGIVAGYIDDYTGNAIMAFLRNVNGTLAAKNFLLPGAADPVTTAPNTAPQFVGTTTSMVVTQNTANISLKHLLAVSDPDAAQTLTWSQDVAPQRGTLSISGATATSGGTNIQAGGSITYTPNTNYFGPEILAVKVSDGVTNTTRTLLLNVVDATPPQVVSVTRKTPSQQRTAGTNVVFTVTFSEPVQIPYPGLVFQVVPVQGSSISAVVASAIGSSPSGASATYDVGVNVLGGTGEFRLHVIQPGYE